MALAMLAAGDSAITFLWVFSMASIGVIATLIAPYLGVEAKGRLLVVIGIMLMIVPFLLQLSRALGGASWNPTGLFAFCFVGASKDTPFSLAVRLPAQMIGAAWGALTISGLMPSQYKHMVNGPRLQVALGFGAIVEGMLTFIITSVLLMTILKGPRNPHLKVTIMVVTIVTLVMLGGAYTGPSMNPVNAFGWAFVNQKHGTWEHFCVYWLGPLIGTVAAVQNYILLFGPSKKIIVHPPLTLHSQ